MTSSEDTKVTTHWSDWVVNARKMLNELREEELKNELNRHNLMKTAIQQNIDFLKRNTSG